MTRTVLCTACGEPTKLGHICDNCTMIDSQNELTYLAALAKDDTALKSLRLMSPAERKRIAPTFLSPDALDSFVRDGVITSQHITDLYPLRRKDRKMTTTSTPKTTSRPRARKATTKVETKPIDSHVEKQLTAKPKMATGSARARMARATELTAAGVAREARIDPRKFRAFLRAEGIDRTFATKAAATLAVKTFKAAHPLPDRNAARPGRTK